MRCTEAFDDPPDATLFPKEAVISRAVEKRPQEFGTAPDEPRANPLRLDQDR